MGATSYPLCNWAVIVGSLELGHYLITAHLCPWVEYEGVRPVPLEQITCPLPISLCIQHLPFSISSENFF